MQFHVLLIQMAAMVIGAPNIMQPIFACYFPHVRAGVQHPPSQQKQKKKKHVKQSGTAVPEITLTAFISSATPDKQTSGIGCAAAELPVQRRSLIQFLQRAFKRLKHISTTNSDQKHPIYLCLPGSSPRMQEKKENK